MTHNKNSYREKGRALFLAAMMVLSVVAMSAAFAGAAAAANEETEVEQGPVAYGPHDSLSSGDEQSIEAVFEDDVSGLSSGDEITVKDRHGEELTWNVDTATNVLILTNDTADDVLIGDGTLEIEWDDTTEEYDIEGTSTAAVDPAYEAGSDSEDAYHGENIAIVGSTGATVDISSEDSSITRGLGSDSNVRTLDTSDDRWSGADNITVDFVGGDDVTIELDDLGLNVETDEDSYWDTQNVTATAEADDIDRPVEFQLLNEDGDEVANVTDKTIGSDGEVDAEFNLSDEDVDHENHTIEVEDISSGVTAESDEFSVEERPDADVAFDGNVVEHLGNIAEITVDIDDYDDEVFVQIGDEEDDNYQDLIGVEDGSDSGNVTIHFNTAEVGEDAYTSLTTTTKST